MAWTPNARMLVLEQALLGVEDLALPAEVVDDLRDRHAVYLVPGRDDRRALGLAVRDVARRAGAEQVVELLLRHRRAVAARRRPWVSPCGCPRVTEVSADRRRVNLPKGVCGARVVQDHVGGLLGDHVDGAGDEEARDAREHRGIDHAQAAACRARERRCRARRRASRGADRARARRVVAPGGVAHVVGQRLVARRPRRRARAPRRSVRSRSAARSCGARSGSPRPRPAGRRRRASLPSSK